MRTQSECNENNNKFSIVRARLRFLFGGFILFLNSVKISTKIILILKTKNPLYGKMNVKFTGTITETPKKWVK